MNFDSLTEVLQLLENSRVAELEVEGENGRLLRLRRTPTPPDRRIGLAPLGLLPEEKQEPETLPLTRVEALLVGRFHNSKKTLSKGDTVEEDEILGAIESMGLMNAVSAPKAGQISAIHVEDGQPVEYGQLLFEID